MLEPADNPLYALLNRIRKPVSLREIIALCLRHVYMGDPFADEGVVPLAPASTFIEQVEVSEMTITGQRCVIYRPRRRAAENLPTMIYLHGGGFVTGCSEDTDYTTRRLCIDNDLAVVSINYPLAPEFVFPQALTACVQVCQWLFSEGDQHGLDMSRVFLGGDSAGGNLAAAIALQMQAQGELLTGLIMLAPWLDLHVESYESYNLLAPEGIVYDAAFIGYARGAYVRHSDWTSPLASPIHCAPARLPPTLVIVGTADPLVDQAVRMHALANNAGLSHIQLVTYEGMPHCFYSFPGLFQEEDDCYRRIRDFVATLNL